MELSPAAARAGLQAAFSRVWLEECEPVARAIFRPLSLHDREDATQEVARRLFKVYPRKIASGATMRWPAYTTTVAKHVLARVLQDDARRRAALGHVHSLDTFRAARLRSRRDDDPFSDSLSAADVAPDPRATADPVAWIVAAELSALIRRSVAALPAQERAVFRAHLEGATDKEAAQLAGLPESTAFRRRTAATLRLQAALRAAGFGLSLPLGVPKKRSTISTKGS